MFTIGELSREEVWRTNWEFREEKKCRRGGIAMFRSSLFAVLVFGLVVTEARGVIVLVLWDDCDDRDAILAVRDVQAVKAFRQRMDKFTNRLRVLKEKDIVALFGKPTTKPAKTFAMPVAQPRTIALSGIRYADHRLNKDHSEFYTIGDFAGIEVYYAIDGETPAAILLYFQRDGKFPKLAKDNLDKRLAWEQERLKKLVAAFEKRWAIVFVWEIDTDQEKNLYQGMDSGDFAVKLQAMMRWGKQQGYRLDHWPAKDDETPRWSWYRGDKLMAEAYHDRGFKGVEGKPCCFILYGSDGKRVRDESGWPSLHAIRFYRVDGTMVRYESGSLHEGNWRPRTWSWHSKKGKAVRSEFDTNSDGVPDSYREGAFHERGPLLSLAVEKSWAVHPEFIPEEFRIPGQADRRVPLRKIKR